MKKYEYFLVAVQVQVLVSIIQGKMSLESSLPRLVLDECGRARWRRFVVKSINSMEGEKRRITKVSEALKIYCVSGYNSGCTRNTDSTPCTEY